MRTATHRRADVGPSLPWTMGLLLAILLVSCARPARPERPPAPPATTTAPVADYYGLAHGAQWHYRGHLRFASQPDSEVVVVSAFVTEMPPAAVLPDKAERTFQLAWRVAGKDAGTDTIILRDDRVLARVSVATGLGLVPLLQAPVLPDASWEWQTAGQSGRGRILREETVTVPAGTYQTIAVEHTQATQSARPQRSTRWLAPGVGVVRFVRPYGRGAEIGQLTAELAVIRYTRA